MGFSGYSRLGVILALILLTACTPMKRFGTNQSLRFVENNLVGPMLEARDVDMACHYGASLAPVIQSTSGLGADNQQLLTLLYLTAGVCAERAAVDTELLYLRAARDQRIEQAQDARIAQRRFAELAAHRQYQAYLNAVGYYEKRFGLSIGEQCPDFASDFDELIFLLGLIQGLQAIQNDINAQGAVGVPRDIAAKTERGMTCLDNAKWWGAPMAARATVWNLLPGSGTGQDAWRVLDQSRQLGERKGVRLAHALHATSAAAAGDEQQLRKVLRAVGASEKADSFQVDTHYNQVDAISHAIVLNIADLYWTRNRGTRTPHDGLLRFWDEPAPVSDTGIELDDLP